jgi:flagellar biogenesis protein FliO
MNARFHAIIGVLGAAAWLTPSLMARGEDEISPSSGALANGSINLIVDEPSDQFAIVPPAREHDQSTHADDGTPSPRNDNSAPLPHSANEARPLGPPSKLSAAGADPMASSQPVAAAISSDNRSRPDRNSSGRGGLVITAIEIGRVGGALAAVLGLVWTIRAFMRRAGLATLCSLTSTGGGGGGQPSGVIEILARYPIPASGGGGRGHSLLLIKVGRRVLLIHSTGSAMSALCEMTDANEVASLLAKLEAGSTPRHAGRFRQALRQFQSSHDVPAFAPAPGGGHPRSREREADRLIGSSLPPEARGPGAGAGARSQDVAEVIDLTRSRMGGLFGLFASRNSDAGDGKAKNRKQRFASANSVTSVVNPFRGGR